MLLWQLNLAAASSDKVNVYWLEIEPTSVVTLAPSRFDNSNSFFAATVNVGAVTLSPALFTNSNNFYSHTLTRGSVTLTVPQIASTNAFYSAVVGVGAVTLSPTLVASSNTFYSHSISQSGATQTLTAARFDNTNTFFGGAVSQGGATQTLTASLFVNRPNASSFTKTLLNFNGTNGSTTIVDGSEAPHTFTAQGSAALSTAEKKFGTASLLLNGIGFSWVQTTTGMDDYRFGTGDFIVEAQAHPVVGFGGSGRALVDFYASTGGGWQVFITSTGKVQWWRSSAMVVESTTLIPLGAWTHILVSRVGTTIRLFINGTLEGSVTDTTNYSGTSINTMAVGAQVHLRNNSYDFNGYIDDVRIQKGVGVTSTTAPTSELENPFFSATITVGAATLSALRFDNSQTFYSHLLTNASPSQTLTATRFDNTSTIYSASLSAAITLSPTLLSNVNDFYTHVIGASAVELSVPLVVNVNEFYGGVVFRAGLSSDYNVNRVVYVPAENTSYGASLSIARTVFVTEASTPTTAVVSQDRTAYVPAEYV